MNGFLLLIPMLLIRYGVLYVVNPGALQRAAYFPPLMGMEKAAFWGYQFSTVFIFAYLFFLRIATKPPWFGMGIVIYGMGVLLCLVSTVHFAKPAENGINRKGIYRFSRNPMYMAYFIFFLGCVLLTASFLLLALLIVFQVSAHWIILSEERWCKLKFGSEYLQYMKKVRRYL